MFWWIVLAVLVIGLALLGYLARSRSRSASSGFDGDALRRTHPERWGSGREGF
jgi:hypothetical protein